MNKKWIAIAIFFISIILMSKGYSVEYDETLTAECNNLTFWGQRNCRDNKGNDLVLGINNSNEENKLTIYAWSTIADPYYSKIEAQCNNNYIASNFFNMSTDINNVQNINFEIPFTPLGGPGMGASCNIKIYELTEKVEPEPEEPTPEEPTPEESTREITKEDFYKMGWVGITALCVLIFMLFFKWCFPMKGGKK